jgi:hypothetical protein
MMTMQNASDLAVIGSRAGPESSAPLPPRRDVLRSCQATGRSEVSAYLKPSYTSSTMTSPEVLVRLSPVPLLNK